MRVHATQLSEMNKKSSLLNWCGVSLLKSFMFQASAHALTLPSRHSFFVIRPDSNVPEEHKLANKKKQLTSMEMFKIIDAGVEIGKTCVDDYMIVVHHNSRFQTDLDVNMLGKRYDAYHQNHRPLRGVVIVVHKDDVEQE